ncbi:hypothetical protein [Sphaerobacter sp.]|uniref:hypothetical protein n=1 Tax=Sphaerobacter sp. TaxID=2099654 RepID=UPI001E02D881|nr:hypothetical protein [Sphaerobacter sp.]MBX5444527.1 hypothetical protein [Sphaerobacter sp.]
MFNLPTKTRRAYRRVAGVLLLASVTLLLAACNSTAAAPSAQADPSPPAATTADAAPTTEEVAEPNPGAGDTYRDDRSTAEAVVESYYNAINRQEYVRAYSYWEPEAAESQLPPFEQFQEGYAQTASVDLTIGTVTSDAGAGQLYNAVPVALVAKQTDGSTQTFVGCYQLHLANPAIQGEPPFRPMGIRSASIDQVPNDADIPSLLETACQE